MDSYNDILLQAACKHYPLKRPEQPAATQSEALANCAKDMWNIFSRTRSHRYSIAGIVTAWRQWADLSRAHRIHKERSKQRAKQRKIDLLQQAQRAADQGNANELWKVVRHRYATDDTQDPIFFPFPQHDGFCLDPQDLEWHLRHLNPCKAVPKGTAPAVVWKACADLIADPVIQCFNRWQGGKPFVLQRWSERSDSPPDWRPIGVQDPLGKCLMSTVVQQAKQAVQELIVRFPQCAYVKNRSTSTALRQVFAHCREVREH